MKSHHEVMQSESLNPKTGVKYEERGPHIDLPGLTRKLGLLFFQYEEELPGQEKVDPKKRETRTAHFLFERGMTTGLKFYKKRAMSELVLNYSIHRLVDRDASLVNFGGLRGCRVATTMSEEDRKEQARKRAEFQAAKEGA